MTSHTTADVIMVDADAHEHPVAPGISQADNSKTMPWESYLPVGTMVTKGRMGDTWRAVTSDNLNILDPKSPLSLLIKAGWVRATGRNHPHANDLMVIRVFLLPNDRGRAVVPRTDGALAKRQLELMQSIDVTSEGWKGNMPCHARCTGFPATSRDDESLFYLFNTIPSPSSLSCHVGDSDAQKSIDALLSEGFFDQCKTKLYPYQRRSAATMIRREVQPRRSLDPRLSQIVGPVGDKMFFDHQTGQLFKDQKTYEEVRGGILAEAMGVGKSLEILATVLATKGHWPSIPPQYSLGLNPKRSHVASLLTMSAHAAGNYNIPWQRKFEMLEEKGEEYGKCRQALRENAATYSIPPLERRHSRRATFAEPRRIMLCSATIIVVPQNLIVHWLREITKHFLKGAFNVLVFDLKVTKVPEPSALVKTDILLFSRQRFEIELCPQGAQRTDNYTCVCAANKSCSCPFSLDYHSPLLDLHFLRVVLDEGHEFASGRKNNAYFALARLIVDRKWLLSGTPTNGLIGVDLSAASQNELSTQEILEARKNDVGFLLECKDLENIQAMVTKFLNVKPWSNEKSEDPASWRRYIMPYQDGRRKPASLRRLLNSLCVRHRLEDIERDVLLPPLHNKIVYLEPSWHDKLSQNAFSCSLISNAVTSNRCDEDYMFHSKNRPVLHSLINNLRQSGFYWTGFTFAELSKMIEVSEAYIEEKNDECNEQDLLLLKQAVSCSQTIIASRSWKIFSDLHELGLWVTSLPSESRQAWSLLPGSDRDPTLMSATQLNQAQTWIFAHLDQDNDQMLLNFRTRGEFVMNRVRKELDRSQRVQDKKTDQSPNGEAQQKKRNKGYRNMYISEPKLSEIRTVSKAKAVAGTRQSPSKAKTPQATTSNLLKPALKSVLKPDQAPTEHLDPSSKLRRSALMGTASAKLTYLLDRVSILHKDEKILIFYEGDHIAYYIAQALDIIDVRYLIYTRTLDLALKSAYVATFNAKQTFRVMLMDLKEAAAGLHIASASRVWFVNGVWNPSTEAQAIKRAHRIGQTRPVYCETLILKDTLEDKMMQRRKRMSAQEHQDAEKSLLDDRIMRETIEHATLLPLSLEEMQDVDSQMAKLASPIDLFAKPHSESIDPTNPYADMIFPIETSKTKKLGIKKSTEEELESDKEPDPLEYEGRISVSDGEVPGKGKGDGVPPAGGFGNPREGSPTIKKKRKRVGFAAAVDEIDCISSGPQADEPAEAESSSTAAKRVQFDLSRATPGTPSLFGG